MRACVRVVQEGTANNKRASRRRLGVEGEDTPMLKKIPGEEVDTKSETRTTRRQLRRRK